MKKLLIVLIVIIPLLGPAQTRPVYYYDSMGRQYSYDPVKFKPKQAVSRKHAPKSKLKTTIIIDRRKIKHTLKY